MTGIRTALVATATLGLGCRFELPSAPTDGPQQDAGADAAHDAPYVPACLTSASYTVRPGTGRSYRVFNNNTNYNSAIDVCAADGAHLDVIDDLAENTYLADLLGSSGDGWLGFDDLTIEGSFAWVTGAIGYNHYMGNEPNNSNGEDCTAINANGVWSDDTCENVNRPICECDPDFRPPPTPACRTMAGAVEPSGRRVFRDQMPAAWAQAKAACEAIGAHLLVIGDLDENQEMTQALSGAHWIGYSDSVQEGLFTWSTGAASAFSNWAGGTVPVNEELDCAILGDNGAWRNVACDELHPYACECDPLPP